MKTILKGFLFCIVFTLFFISSYGQEKESFESVKSKEIVFDKINPIKLDVKFHQHNTGELVISLNEKNKKTFNYFVIQYEGQLDNAPLINDLYNVTLKSNYLHLENSDKNLIFTLDDKKIVDLDDDQVHYFSVYGISKRFTGEKQISISQIKTG
ncbi:MULTISPECIES: hypothetical protein [Winogradskyella]|uniref:Uncharacterized protein n=1 Tax=Winogradskyella ouciana TaxID=2608631 RepID=A0A7K1GDE2_9FLAO|nr:MULTISPECIES: hypothetical protein [Winogradskyella]MBO6880706.1 hypothetical protein [Winogradskyella sp.]MTE27322.1 hypothetical protein [Winogradskyella ouciana]